MKSASPCLALVLFLAQAAPPRETSTAEWRPREDSTAVLFEFPSTPPVNGTVRRVSKVSADAREVRARSLQLILGGRVAEPGQWPFSVALAFRNQQGTLTQYCGGSLIAPDTVLTAAHCEVASGDYAILGRHDLSSRNGRALRIVSVVSHLGFDHQSNQNDIALVRLAAPVTEFAPVPLASNDLVLPEGQVVTALGWGRSREGGATSLVLREVSLPVAPRGPCATQYEGIYPIVDSMLCTRAPGSKNTCQGDSGGPLLLTKPDGTVVQVGITSFGVGCARPEFDGVYTRVSSFREWIDRNLPR